MTNHELNFEVKQDGGVFVAVCHHPEMATEADLVGGLQPMICDLLDCHLEPSDERRHWPVRLNFVNDPVLWLLPE